ncbi:MAG: glycosyltransferase, partial [Dolichospermum sp.]
MEKLLPRLLLVSEIPLSQEGTGINRTLVNLLEGYPVDNFMLFKSSAKNSDQTAPRFSQNVDTISAEFLPFLNNRFGNLVNGIISQINLQLIDWLPIFERKKIDAFAPEVILICPSSASGLLIGHKIIKTFDIPYLIYLMDDWTKSNHYQWLTGSVQESTTYLLNNASGWLMISQQLEQELAQRYKIVPKRSLIVHNPVDLSNKTLPDFTPHYRDKFRVIYAGGIWPMHYDAVAVVAEAIYELRRDGVDIELVLHTAPNFWEIYQKQWVKWQVTYGDLIPYKELNQYLQKADLLLVASSFFPENYSITSSSVQTKLTDYMVSGRPILACGPSYAACNQFIKNWNCGLVCETNVVSEIKEIFLKQKESIAELYVFAKNGFEVLQDNFEAKKVRYKLY